MRSTAVTRVIRTPYISVPSRIVAIDRAEWGARSTIVGDGTEEHPCDLLEWLARAEERPRRFCG